MLERSGKLIASPTSEWFVLRVRPRHEKTVAWQLREKEQHSFLPLMRVKREWGKKTVSVELPLFPGYVFCHADRHRLLPILKTTGVIDVLRMGGTPAPVERKEVEDIERVIATHARIESSNYISAGQMVRIVDGPFRNLCGYLIEVRNSQRLVLSVTLLQRSILVEIDTAAVVPVDQPYTVTEFARSKAAV